MQQIRLIPICLISISLVLLVPSARAANLETDFSAYDLKEYGTNPIEANWNSVRFTLTTYDENPTKVTEQIAAMCGKGQKKIGLVLWFLPQTYDGSWADSSTGKPTIKVQNNITAVLTHIKNQKNGQNQSCFNEVQFRFAPMGPSQPLGWTTWDESRYLQNKSFIWFTRNLVKSALSDSVVAVVFDLAAEQAGQDAGQNAAYLRRIWKDYTNEFGVKDTYGFSIAWDPGRFTKLIAVYDAVGKRPAQHAVDIYDNSNIGLIPQLTALQNEMNQAGEGTKPLLIQETYFADQQVFTEINAMRNQGLNVRAIMQWQVTRQDFFRSDGQYRHLSTVKTDYLYFASNPSDLNSDGTVDIFDYNLLVSKFGNPYSIFDYNELVANFGK